MGDKGIILMPKLTDVQRKRVDAALKIANDKCTLSNMNDFLQSIRQQGIIISTMNFPQLSKSAYEIVAAFVRDIESGKSIIFTKENTEESSNDYYDFFHIAHEYGHYLMYTNKTAFYQ